MPTEFQAQAEVIEECYEFTLSYAAQGHGMEGGSTQGRQLREHLTRAVNAMRGLESACAAAMRAEQLVPAAPYEAFFRVLGRDAQDAVAAMELVLAQPAISSQLIDNLNASIHLRALLTDIFLVAEILEAHQGRAAASQHELL
jgi:hypothetical protein